MEALTKVAPMETLPVLGTPESTQCTAHSTRTGERCKKRAIRGTNVCGTHGGKAPQVLRRAKQRIAEQEAFAVAQRMCERDGVEMDPIEHLLDSLHLAYQLVKVYGSMAAELDDYAEETVPLEGTRGITDFKDQDPMLVSNSKGDIELHPYVRAYHEAVDRHAKIAKLCIDAGVEVKRLQLQEQQAEEVITAFELTLGKLNITPLERQEARLEYANHLRSGQ